MRKSTRIIKKLLAIFLVVLISIESFAAVVSDNDGSAFITKAEFESMKEDFAEQIDKYNNSIDSKIDGSIAAYLAGLAQNKVVEKNLTISHTTRTFVRTFGLSNTNRKGDYVEGYASVVLSGCNNDATWTTGNVSKTKMILVEFNTNGGVPSLQSKGTNKDCFLLINNSTWNDSYMTAINHMRSIPYSAWGGCYFHHGNPPRNGNGPIPAAFVVSLDRTTWGSEDKPATINIAGTSMECAAVAYTINKDEILNEQNLKNLAGSNVSNDILYTVHINDTETKGPRSTDIDIDGGWLRVRYDGTETIGQGDKWPRNKGFYLFTYHHKYENIYKLSDFIVDSLSATLKEPIRYYSGLPLFRATNNGTVEFKLKLTNAGNETSKVAISNKAFENVAFAEGMDIGNESDWSINGSSTFPSSFSAGTTYTIKMDVVKDKVYFIKVLPSTNNNNTKVDIVGDILNTPS